MDLGTSRQGRVDATRRRIASVALLVFAVVPAVALYALENASWATDGALDPIHRTLIVIVPLSTFLLLVFLWQARSRIVHLEAKEAAALENSEIDALSGLPNRPRFDRSLSQAIDTCTMDAPVALLAIDVDMFKGVNDTHGHLAGDRLIVEVSERIRRIAGVGDCVARVGGDEFAIVLTGIRNVSQCAAMAHRLRDAMLAPIDLGSAQIFVTLSIGIALAPQDGDTRIMLGNAADLALYRAKREGRNRFAFFDKTMETTLHLGMTIEDDLRAAIADDGLSIAYQPLMAPCGTRMQGVEALVRWTHPQLGPIAPEQFVPLAESRGLIVPLGEWVLRRACLDARRWPALRIAVNVSPVQFRQRGFVDVVRSVIQTSGIEASRLDLELTEGVLIQDSEQAEAVIIELRALGIRLGLDDFGSGYSSMIYLRRFAFDKIKIDRAFLESVESSGEGAIILESIVTLGHALGLTVTAEGVEHEDQVRHLQKLGCDEMQGFYFAPPLPAEAIDERLSLQAWSRPDVTEPGRSAAA